LRYQQHNPTYKPQKENQKYHMPLINGLTMTAKKNKELRKELRILSNQKHRDADNENIHHLYHEKT